MGGAGVAQGLVMGGAGSRPAAPRPAVLLCIQVPCRQREQDLPVSKQHSPGHRPKPSLKGHVGSHMRSHTHCPIKPDTHLTTRHGGTPAHTHPHIARAEVHRWVSFQFIVLIFKSNSQPNTRISDCGLFFIFCIIFTGAFLYFFLNC